MAGRPISAATRGAPQGVGRAPLPALAAREVLALAGLAGLFVAVAGGLAGTRAVYYAAVLGGVAAVGLVAVTRPEPARFAFLLLVACLPFAEWPVPPGRLGIRVFDVVALALAGALVVRRLRGRRPRQTALLPSRSWTVAWTAFLVCVACSLYPAVSLQMILVAAGAYAFFLFALEELRREGGFERLAALWSVVVLAVSAGLFVDHWLHLNLSLRGSNLNQLSRIMGTEVWRAGGFFQDPQKAGAFLAALVAFLLVAAVRGRFAGRLRLLVWLSVAAGLAALMTTVSRGAILACLFVSVVALFAANRWPPAVRLLAVALAVLAALGLAMSPAGLWSDLVPDTVAARFAQMAGEFQIRTMIWFDTWDMFARHPLTGIGPGSFQSYLIETRPGVTGYYGIGVAEGAGYVPEQPESGYLTLLYEGGLLGAGAALWLLADALWRAFAALARRPPDDAARGEMIAVLAALAASAVTFVTLFTAGDSRIAALLMFFFAVIWSRSPAAGAGPARRPRAHGP